MFRLFIIFRNVPMLPDTRRAGRPRAPPAIASVRSSGVTPTYNFKTPTPTHLHGEHEHLKPPGPMRVCVLVLCVCVRVVPSLPVVFAVVLHRPPELCVYFGKNVMP